ncbi:MAG: glycosyltransferase family 4 protein [Acidobacteriota bacterium]
MVRLGIDARKLADFGIGSYLRGLLGELATCDMPGDTVVFVAPESRSLLPELPPGWRIVEVDAPGYSLKEQAALPLAALRAGVRVLHVPHYVVPMLFPGRLVVTIHDIIHVLFPEFLPSNIGFAYARFFIQAAVRRARWVITVSETTARDLRRLFRAPAEHLRVVPHGVDEIFLAPADERVDEQARARFGVAHPYLLHVGNHKPHKNAEGLLKAYQALVHDGRGEVPPLVMVGGFKPDGELAQRSVAMGLGGRVRCLGHVTRPELVALFHGATLFLYPTLYEGFGLPVLEAMACGVPVVAGDIMAVREVAGDAVIRVNPRDVMDLAGETRRLLEHAELRQQLVDKGRKRAQSFSWRQAAESTLDIYRAVAAEA